MCSIRVYTKTPSPVPWMGEGWDEGNLSRNTALTPTLSRSRRGRGGYLFIFLWMGCFAVLKYACLFAETATVDSANPRYIQGLAYERLGKLNEAYTELQVACALNSNSAAMAVALGIVALRLNRWEEAQRALEHSIALDANSAASYYHLGLIYEKKNLRDRATESWQRFLQLSQDENLKNIARKHLQYLESGP